MESNLLANQLAKRWLASAIHGNNSRIHFSPPRWEIENLIENGKLLPLHPGESEQVLRNLLALEINHFLIKESKNKRKEIKETVRTLEKLHKEHQGWNEKNAPFLIVEQST